MNTNGQETLRLSPPTRLWQAVKASGNLLWNRKLEGVGRPSRPTDPPLHFTPLGGPGPDPVAASQASDTACSPCLPLSFSLPPFLFTAVFLFKSSP